MSRMPQCVAFCQTVLFCARIFGFCRAFHQKQSRIKACVGVFSAASRQIYAVFFFFVCVFRVFSFMIH